METLDEFVERLSRAVNCYYHLCPSGIFSLKKFNTDIRGKQQVFAWVQERRRKGLFKIDAYKHHAEKSGVISLADGERPNLNWLHPGLLFFVKKGSVGEDYQKAVKALKTILLVI